MTSPGSERLIDALKDNLSPEAVALIAAKCQPAYARGEAGEQAEREVRWFTDQLIATLGHDQWNALCEQLGL